MIKRNWLRLKKAWIGFTQVSLWAIISGGGGQNQPCLKTYLWNNITALFRVVFGWKTKEKEMRWKVVVSRCSSLSCGFRTEGKSCLSTSNPSKCFRMPYEGYTSICCNYGQDQCKTIDAFNLIQFNTVYSIECFNFKRTVFTNIVIRLLYFSKLYCL